MQVQIAGMMRAVLRGERCERKDVVDSGRFRSRTSCPDCGGGSNYAGAALVWGAGFPLFMIVRNWRALKYSKKRPFNAEQVASNFEKGMQDKSKKRWLK